MDGKRCLICAVSIGQDSLRLGLEACRSCAAFFKRTKLAGRKFACRQGDKQCSTRKADKLMCRRCRYAKCVRLGMELHQRNLKVNELERVETVVPSTSSSDDRFCRENSLLPRMESEYRASCERRLAVEKEYVAKHNLPPFYHPDKKFFHANFTAFRALHRITIKESASLIWKVFDDFDTFPDEHRMTLYKNFAIKFSMTEGVYFTAKHFKGSSKFASSLISCASAEIWRLHDDKLMNNNALRTSVKQFTGDYKDLFEQMSKMNCLTEREFYALVILNYCDIDNLALPDDIVRSTQRIRSRTFAELQEYYRCELKLRDFSQRMGNLMTLAHCTGEAAKLMNEEMRMYATIFDLHSYDQVFQEF